MGKKELKGFFIGMIFTAIISASAITVIAAVPEIREIFFGVEISLDGEMLEFPEDAQPFVLDGRTYLPVRAIAGIFGVNVAVVDGVVTLTTPLEPSAPMPTPIPEPTPPHGTVIPRGIWLGNFFTAGHLGFSFEMPEGWTAVTGAETHAAYDLAVTSPLGASVRLAYRFTALSEWEFFIDMMEASREAGMDVLAVSTVEIGRYEWLAFQTAVEIPELELTVFGHYFVSAPDGIARIITVLTSDVSETVEEILAMFE